MKKEDVKNKGSKYQYNKGFLVLLGIVVVLLIAALLGIFTDNQRIRDGVEVQGEVIGTSITYSSEADTWYFVRWEYERIEYNGTYMGSFWTMMNRLLRGQGLHPKQGDEVAVYFYPDNPHLHTIDDSKNASNLMLIVCLIALPCSMMGLLLTRKKR